MALSTVDMAAFDSDVMDLVPVDLITVRLLGLFHIDQATMSFSHESLSAVDLATLDWVSVDCAVGDFVAFSNVNMILACLVPLSYIDLVAVGLMSLSYVDLTTVNPSTSWDVITACD